MAHQGQQGLPVPNGHLGNPANNYPLGPIGGNPQDQRRRPRNPRNHQAGPRRPRPQQTGSWTQSTDRTIIDKNVIESIVSTTFIDHTNKRRKVVEIQRDENTRIRREKLKTGRNALKIDNIL